MLIEETVRRRGPDDCLWLLHDGRKVADRDAGIELASELATSHTPETLWGEVGRSVFRVNETEWLVVMDGSSRAPGGRMHFRLTVAELVGEFAPPENPYGHGAVL